MMEPIGYLMDLVRSGGPEEDQYGEFSRQIQEFNLIKLRGEYRQHGPDLAGNVFGDALSFNTMQGFAYHKPHGYAGDYELLERIYGNYQTSNENLVKWDVFLQQQPIVEALRESKDYFKSVMAEADSVLDSPQVLNVASGSSRAVAEYLSESESEARFCCLDQDWEALDYARLLCRNHPQQVDFRHGVVSQLDASEQYNLIWSEGLFDYLTDGSFKKVLGRMLKHLLPGGQIVLGNLSTDNPGAEYFQFLEWRLNYRSEVHLRYLARCCGLKDRQMTVVQDRIGVNQYLHIQL